MAKLARNVDEEYFIVHKLHGNKDGINFLKQNSPKYSEELIFNAKKHGLSEFEFRGLKYSIRHDPDNSFTIEAQESEESEN